MFNKNYSNIEKEAWKNFENKNFEESLKLYLECLENDKTNINYWFGVGISYLNLNKIALANEHFFVAHVLDATNFAVLYNLSYTFYLIGEYNTALRFFNKLDPSTIRYSPYLFHQGLCYYHLKDFAKAKEYFIKTIQLDYSYKEAYFHLALVEINFANWNNVSYYLNLAAEHGYDKDEIINLKDLVIKSISINNRNVI